MTIMSESKMFCKLCLQPLAEDDGRDVLYRTAFSRLVFQLSQLPQVASFSGKGVQEFSGNAVFPGGNLWFALIGSRNL
jgi:hypothetical protein